MQGQYRLILISDKVYREVALTETTQKLVIGTGQDADVRFRREDFFAPFSFRILKNGDQWELECEEELYIAVNDLRKLMVLTLTLNAPFVLKYRSSEMELLTVHFRLDFDSENGTYDSVIDLSHYPSLRVGSTAACQIQLRSPLTQRDCFSITRAQNGYVLSVESSDVGTFYNGNLLGSAIALRPMDFISVGPYRFCYFKEKLYLDQRANLAIQNIACEAVKESLSHHEYPRFQRSSRVWAKLPDEKIKILDPPSVPTKPKSNIVTQLFPALAMLVIIVLLRGVMNSSGMSFVLFSACSMVVGVVTTVMNIRNEKKNYKESVKKREESYQRYIEEKKKSIAKKHAEEVRILEDRHYSAAREIQQIMEFRPELFDRKPEDEDFLEVRLGTGKRASSQKIEYRQQERVEASDELMKIPGEMEKEFEMIHQAPVVLGLKDISVAGVAGSREALCHMLKRMVLDLVTRQYYGEMNLCVCMEEQDQKDFEWLCMLPHLQNEALNRRNIICDEESRAVLLEELYKRLLAGKEAKGLPHLVVLMYRDVRIRTHPLFEFLKNAKEKGVTFLFFEEYEEYLPTECEYVVRMDDVTRGTKVFCGDGTKVEPFESPLLSNQELSAVSKKLAPVYCEKISLESSLTQNISLFELLHIYEPQDVDLERCWEEAEVYRSMAAPLGVKSKNQMVYLDLHERAQGPHGLVAGTTGSGKSELLQSYIISMALRFHPYDVGFVLIDFKGGGMANQFQKLPHLIGTITNMDGRETERSLLSIRAELKKRQALFAQYEVNHIDAYIKLYKQHKAKEPLPHLILIVDEFAELKMEQPEFMKELISTARIGRSLGVHLILATQKPSGVVDPQIWSNSRFRLCLKVQTREDSNEVLKSPLAADIAEPGRAYLQVGNNEMFELFQSAYSGGPASMEGSTQKKSFRISKVAFSGKRIPAYERKVTESGNQSISQLGSVVSYVSEYCSLQGIERLPFICMPPLPEIIAAPMGERAASILGGLTAYVGILDEPQRQKQDTLALNVTVANTILIGSAQNGKTNFLQTAATSLAARYTPEEVNLYLLDFGSMIFRNYEALPQVGGVVCAQEEEKCRNLFKMLSQEIQDRKEMLIAAGVSSFSSYLESGGNKVPQIVVLIDNLTAFRELYLMESDFLLPICREGIAVGITFVIANAQTSGIGYKYLANFEQRMALTCNDTTEYNALFDHCRIQPYHIPGRCLIEQEKNIYEMQIYLAFDGEKEIDRVGQILDFVEQKKDGWSGKRAKKIPMVPDQVTEAVLREEFGCGMTETAPEHFPIGVDFDRVEAVEIDWKKQGVLAICGQEEDERIGFVRYLLAKLEKAGAQIYILDDYTRAFSDDARHQKINLYSQELEDIDEILMEMESQLEERMKRMLREGKEAVLSFTPMILLIQNREAAAYISKKPESLRRYKDILGKYQGLMCCILFTNLENGTISFNAPEVLKMMRDNRAFLAFEDLENVKVFETTTSLQRKYSAPRESQEAFYLSGNTLKKIKTAILE